MNPQALNNDAQNEDFTLLDICSKVVAESIPFSSIEERYDSIIPEPVQKKIIFYSFPKSEESILLYSTLNNNAGTSTNSSSTSASTQNNFLNILNVGTIENPLLDHQLNGNGGGDELNVGLGQFGELESSALPSTSSGSGASSSFSKGMRILEDFVGKCGSFHKGLQRINSRFNSSVFNSSQRRSNNSQQQGPKAKKRRLKQLCSSSNNFSNNSNSNKRMRLEEEGDSSDLDNYSSDDWFNSDGQSSSEDESKRHSPTGKKALAKRHSKTYSSNYSKGGKGSSSTGGGGKSGGKKGPSSICHKSKRRGKRVVRVHIHHRIENVLQVGFHLSGTVVQFNYNAYNLAMENNTPNKLASSSSSGRESLGHGSKQGNKQIIVQNCNKRLLCSNVHSNELYTELTSEMNQSTGNQSSKFYTSFRVSVTFDRCKITSTSCTCTHQDIFWCEHVVALALYRIRFAEQIQLRVPISETLLQMDRNQLQKLVQYLISDHLADILPTAQNYADLILRKCGKDEINQIAGAPDPTIYPNDENEDDEGWRWYLDEEQVVAQVRACLSNKSSNKLILGASQQQKNSNKHQILQSLFLKVREMLRAGDSNGPRLLTIITQEFLNNSLSEADGASRSGQWRNLRERQEHQRSNANRNNNIVPVGLCSTEIPRNRQLWDEIGHLWTCVVMNPNSTLEIKSGLRKLLLGFNEHPAACLLEDPSDAESVLEYLPCQECICCRRSIECLENTEYKASPSSSRLAANKSPSPKPSTSKNTYKGKGYENITSPKSSGGRRHSGKMMPSPPLKPFPPLIRTVFTRALEFTEIEWPKTFLIGLEDIVDLDLMTARVEAYRSHGHDIEAVSLAVEIVKSLRSPRRGPPSQEKIDLPSAKCPQHGFKSHLNRQLEPFYILFDTLVEAAFNSNPLSSGNKRGRSGKNYSRSKLMALAYEVALKGLGMNREMPRGLYAQERLARLEERFIVKLQELEVRVKNDSRELRETLVKVLLREARNFLLIGETGSAGFYSEDEEDGEFVHLRRSPNPSSKMQTRRSSPQPLNLNIKNTRAGTYVASPQSSGGRKSKCKCTCKQCCASHCSSRHAKNFPCSSAFSTSVGPASMPMHVFGRYLFNSLLSYDPELAYEIGLRAMPLRYLDDYLKECDTEAEVASRGGGLFCGSQKMSSGGYNSGKSCCSHHHHHHHNNHRSLNRWYTLGHIEVQQCTLASTLLLSASAGSSYGGLNDCSNIGGSGELDMLPAILDSAMQHIHSSSHLFRLAQECFRNATSSSVSSSQPIPAAHSQQHNSGVGGSETSNTRSSTSSSRSGNTVENQPHIQRLRLLSASYKLGLKVMRMTLNSVQRRRWEMVGWMVGCGVELGLDAVLNLLQNWWEYFNPTEAAGSLASVVMNRTMNCSSSSFRARFGGLKGMEELGRTAREVALQCSRRDPPNCALNALTLCENDPIAFETAHEIVVDAATKNVGHSLMTSQQIFTIARYMEHRGYPMRAYKLALLALDNVVIGFNQDTHPGIGDIHWACGLSNSLGRSELTGIIPILIKNVNCATVLSDILKRCQGLPSGGGPSGSGPMSMLNPPLMGGSSNKKGHHDPFSSSCGHGGNSSKLCHSKSSVSSVTSGYSGIPCPPSCPHFAASSSNQIQAHSRHHQHLVLNYDRPPLKHLVDATIAAFINTIHSRLTHISPRHYTDFIEYLAKARESFLLSSDGLEKFHQMLDNMSLSYKGKKKLMFLVKERFGELGGSGSGSLNN